MKPPRTRTTRSSSQDHGQCALFGGLLDTAHDPLLLVDLRLRIVAASRSFYRIFNLRPQEIEGRGLFAVANRRFHVPGLRVLLDRVSGRAVTWEYSEADGGFALADGHVVRASASCPYSGSDRLRRILLAFEDMSAAVRAKEHLREEIETLRLAAREVKHGEERFRTLVETMNDGFAVRDETGVFTYVNGKFCDMLGYDREEIVGRRVTDFLDEINQSIFREQFQLRSKGESAQYGLTMTRKDGQKVHTFLSARPIFDSRNRVTGGFAVVTDITGLKTAEAALRDSEKKLRQLSSHLLDSREKEAERISRELHDQVGQDLAILKHQTRFIGQRLRRDQQVLKDTSADALSHLDTIMDGVRRIARDLSPAILQNLGLTTSVQKLCGDLSMHAGIEVALDLDHVDGLMSRDAELNLYRIIQEALTNVRKHAEASSVSISVRKTDEGLTCRIVDDGRGFSSGTGSEADPDRKGMGLTIMEERARIIGAVIEIKSSENAGTEILLKVPLGVQGKV
ncbi:MAG: PAS domain S-box protein [Syntrophobacteraceae bacterium]